MNKRAYGFTIVELLIVIVIIAILAAISIVAYRGIQDRANNASASASAAQAAKKVSIYYAENESYPSSLSQADISNTTGLQYSFNNSVNPKTYCITATNNGKSYYINNTTATSPTQGGCAGHGVGGVEAVTNYVRNPDLVSTSQTDLNYNANATRSVTSGILRAQVTSLISPETTTNGVSIYGLVDVGSLYSAKFRIRGINGAIGKSSWSVLYGGGQRGQSGTYIITSDWQEVNVLAQSAATSTSTHLYIYFGKASDGWAVGDAIEVTQPTIQKVIATGQPAPYGFYSGSSPNWIWNGTPNSSTSTGPAL